MSRKVEESRMKRVSFHEKQTFHRTLSRHDMNAKERQCYWYDGKDFDGIREEIQQTIEAYEKSPRKFNRNNNEKATDDAIIPKQTMRGLECRTENGKYASQSRKMSAVSCVLVLQEKYRRESSSEIDLINDNDASLSISNRYIKHTQRDRKAARQRGFADEIAAYGRQLTQQKQTTTTTMTMAESTTGTGIGKTNISHNRGHGVQNKDAGFKLVRRWSRRVLPQRVNPFQQQ